MPDPGAPGPVWARGTTFDPVVRAAAANGAAGWDAPGKEAVQQPRTEAGAPKKKTHPQQIGTANQGPG
jgi:hypothetical protein